MTIKDNILVVLKKGNADEDEDIYQNVLNSTIAWIKDQSKNFKYNELKKVVEIPVASGSKYVDLPDDYNKIENAVLIKDNLQYYLGVYDIKDIEGKREIYGIPTMIAVDYPQRKLCFYPYPNTDYVLRLRYYSFYSDLTEDDEVFLPDKIIQQVAYIYLLQYDRLDSTVEEMKLDKMLNEFRRNDTLDLDGNVRINLSKNVYRVKKYNFRL
ncbi:MAG TPA: hypothetical protein PKV21_07375 [bacterium]|nr:hypothetical protein [bacterium]